MATDIVRGLRNQIADRLREDILSGRLQEGERLSETWLADRFGVSRGPVREALVHLTQEGLLVSRPNRGVRVAAATAESVHDLLIPIRRAIETFALRLVFDDLNDDDFRLWDETLQRMAAACARQNWAAAVEQDIAFHRALLERSGQPDLLAIWSTLVARIRRHFWRTHMSRKDNPIDVHADHRLLIDAFRGGDKEAAVRALEQHID